MDLCAAAWKLGYGEWGNSAFPKQISIFLESYVVSCISENYICLLISTGHGLSLCQWNLVLWELMDRWMWKLIACLGLSHVSCQWVFSRAQLQYQEAGFHICWHAPCPFVSRNFAALEIRHISRRKMIRVGKLVLQHLSGACRLPHPEKRSRQEEMIPSSSVTVKKLLEWLMGLEADRGWSWSWQVCKGAHVTQSMITICQKPQGYVDLAHIMLCAHSRTKYQSSSTSCILALWLCI